MITATREIYQIIKDKHIPVSIICKETGLNPKKIYPSLKKNAKRELRADELLIICRFLNINPLELHDLYNFKLTKPAQEKPA